MGRFIHATANRASAVLESLLAVALFGLFVIVLLLVVLRYLFSTTIIGGNEATVIAFVFITAIGAAVDLYEDRHISITWFVDRMSERPQAILNTIRFTLLTVLNATLFYLSILWIGKTGHFLMPALGVPQWVAQVSVPVCCGLATLYCLARLGPSHSRAG